MSIGTLFVLIGLILFVVALVVEFLPVVSRVVHVLLALAGIFTALGELLGAQRLIHT